MNELENKEKAIISCILKDGTKSIVKAIESGLRTKDFKNHSKVFKLIVDSYNNGINPITENLIVRDANLTNEIFDLEDFTETTANYESFLELFVEENKRLNSIQFLSKELEKLKTSEIKPEQVSENLNNFCQGIVSDKKAKTLKQGFQNIHEKAVEYADNPELDVDYGTWGVGGMDENLGSIGQNDYVVICARPSTGKTSLAVQTAIANAKKGLKVAFFSYESSLNDITEIAIAQENQVRFNELVKHKSVRDNLIKFDDLDYRENIKIFTRHMTIEEIITHVKGLQINNDIDVVLIDYLQLIIPTNRRDIREQQIAHISRQIRRLTIDNDLPVIALAQLNRVSAQENRPPKMEDLRESGAIEQDASNIIAIYRPNKNFEGVEQTKESGFTGSSYHTVLSQLKKKKGQRDIDYATIFHGYTQQFQQYKNN